MYRNLIKKIKLWSNLKVSRQCYYLSKTYLYRVERLFYISESLKNIIILQKYQKGNSYSSKY